MIKARSVQYNQNHHSGSNQQAHQAPKPVESKLKKSASKDSLVSNMLLSVTKFLGGGVSSTAAEKNEEEQTAR